MREIGTPKIGSQITNLHIKRPRIIVNQRIGYRKEVISGSHIRKIEDKKTAYNKGCLYIQFQLVEMKTFQSASECKTAVYFEIYLVHTLS